MKILLIHGVGHKEADGSWDREWQDAIGKAIGSFAAGTQPQYEKLPYDSFFNEADLDAAVVAEATARLLASGVWHGIGDLFKSRSFGDTLRWTAGMVAQWAADEKLRTRCNSALEKMVGQFQPDIICAHSLGSLIAYDAFARNQDLLAGRTFITFGSQVGNPFVRSIFGGRIVPLANATYWYHLYNEEDDVLTAEIKLSAPNFEQVTTFFDIPGYADHDPVQYLAHPNTIDRVWRRVIAPEPATLFRSLGTVRAVSIKPQHRALLVGINDYPNPADRLEGCVNDVYRMSEVLQEVGFAAENIRVVLNDRATADGIRERLEWLLDGAGDGDQRFFFYSGHGAQVSGYDATGEVDHTDECLVPFDFDWTKDRAVTDDWFCQLYSQLPYTANFVATLDCCHSGGMTRNGSLRVRGLNPPDDIRHRSLRWDAKTGMWVTRDLPMADRQLLDRSSEQKAYVGSSGAVRRLCRAVPLWTTYTGFDNAKTAYDHRGPYVPILLEACQESEYSYEYRHGVTSYGAFTYCLTTLFRKYRASKKPVSWDTLMKETSARLKKLKYQQTPELVCPDAKKNSPIW